MNRCRKPAVVFAFIVFFLSGAIHGGTAGLQEPAKQHAAQKQTADAVIAVENDAGTQKERFLREAESALDKLDQRIQKFKQRLDEKWEEMEPRVKQQAKQALEAMEAERKALSEKLNRLKEGSKEAWEQMKDDLRKRYESLKDMLKKDIWEPPREKETYV